MCMPVQHYERGAEDSLSRFNYIGASDCSFPSPSFAYASKIILHGEALASARSEASLASD
eukprot:6219560-Amphidinium_carterae.1